MGIPKRPSTTDLCWWLTGQVFHMQGCLRFYRFQCFLMMAWESHRFLALYSYSQLVVPAAWALPSPSSPTSNQGSGPIQFCFWDLSLHLFFLYHAVCHCISSNPHILITALICSELWKHHLKSDNCKHLYWLMPLTGSPFPTFSTWLLEVSALIHVLRKYHRFFSATHFL